MVNIRKKTDDNFSYHPYGLQASYSIYGEGIQETFERETKALKQLDAFLSLKRMVIVIYNEEGTVPLDNRK